MDGLTAEDDRCLLKRMKLVRGVMQHAKAWGNERTCRERLKGYIVPLETDKVYQPWSTKLTSRHNVSPVDPNKEQQIFRLFRHIGDDWATRAERACDNGALDICIRNLRQDNSVIRCGGKCRQTVHIFIISSVALVILLVLVMLLPPIIYVWRGIRSSSYLRWPWA